MMRRGWLYALPVLVFAGLIAGFYYGLQIDSTVLPSALIVMTSHMKRRTPLGLAAARMSWKCRSSRRSSAPRVRCPC